MIWRVLIILLCAGIVSGWRVGSNLSVATFSPDATSFLNPERGWYGDIGDGSTPCTAATNFSSYRGNNKGMSRVYVRLDAYVSSPLPQSILDNLTGCFAQIRSAGIKVEPRFTYNFGGGAPCTDATLTQILAHIAQLTPVLQANIDVIAFLHAGFIGCWGQWWGSANTLNTNQSATQQILAAELAIDPNLVVMIPYPDSVRYALGAANIQTRVGIANDCFQSTNNSDDDEFGRLNGVDQTGQPGYAAQITTDRTYMQTLGGITNANGGEGQPSCPYTAVYSDCAASIAAMQTYSISYFAVFASLHPSTWASDSGNCAATMQDSMGYRLELQRVQYPASISKGSLFSFNLALVNRGYAGPINQHPINAVLSDGTHTYVLSSSIDWRTWRPGSGISAWGQATVPSGAVSGTYSLYLWIPDSHASLQSNPLYDVRLANSGVWDGTTGYNKICDTCVTVH